MEMLPSGMNAFPTEVHITARCSDKNVQETPNLVSHTILCLTVYKFGKYLWSMKK